MSSYIFFGIRADVKIEDVGIRGDKDGGSFCDVIGLQVLLVNCYQRCPLMLVHLLWSYIRGNVKMEQSCDIK